MITKDSALTFAAVQITEGHGSERLPDTVGDRRLTTALSLHYMKVPQLAHRYLPGRSQTKADASNRMISIPLGNVDSATPLSVKDCTYPPLVLQVAQRSHLPVPGSGIKLSSSSTWGRADQQTSQDPMDLGRFVLRAKSPQGAFVLPDSTAEPFTVLGTGSIVVLEQHLGEG